MSPARPGPSTLDHSGLLYFDQEQHNPHHCPEVLSGIQEWWNQLGYRTKIVWYRGADDGSPHGWRLYIGTEADDCKVVYRPLRIRASPVLWKELLDEGIPAQMISHGHVALKATPQELEKLRESPDFRCDAPWSVRVARVSVILTEPFTGATIEFVSNDVEHHQD